MPLSLYGIKRFSKIQFLLFSLLSSHLDIMAKHTGPPCPYIIAITSKHTRNWTLMWLVCSLGKKNPDALLTNLTTFFFCMSVGSQGYNYFQITSIAWKMHVATLFNALVSLQISFCLCHWQWQVNHLPPKPTYFLIDRSLGPRLLTLIIILQLYIASSGLQWWHLMQSQATLCRYTVRVLSGNCFYMAMQMHVNTSSTHHHEYP